jgi:tetratricopeptide (TPR) repeat protein
MLLQIYSKNFLYRKRVLNFSYFCKDMSTFLEQARQAVQANQFEQAIALFTQAIQENDTPGLYWERATAQIGAQKFDFALVDMNTYFEKKPDESNPEMYRQRVILSYNLKQYAITKADLEKIMQLNANNPNYNPSEDYFWLGQCYFFLNDIPNAKTSWEKSSDDRAKQALAALMKEQGNATNTENSTQNEEKPAENKTEKEETTKEPEKKGLAENDPAHQTAKRRLQAVAKTASNNTFNRTNTFSLSTSANPDYDLIVTAIENVAPAAYLYLDGKTPKVTQYAETKESGEKVYSIELSVYGLSIFADLATESNVFSIHNPLNFTVQTLLTYDAENRVCTLIRQQLQKLGYQ